MLQYLSFHREKVINVHKAVFINIVSVVQLSIMKIWKMNVRQILCSVNNLVTLNCSVLLLVEVKNIYRGSPPYAFFGTWKKHKPKNVLVETVLVIFV